jgi:hypothetical protein
MVRSRDLSQFPHGNLDFPDIHGDVLLTQISRSIHNDILQKQNCVVLYFPRLPCQGLTSSLMNVWRLRSWEIGHVSLERTFFHECGFSCDVIGDNMWNSA